MNVADPYADAFRTENDRIALAQSAVISAQWAERERLRGVARTQMQSLLRRLDTEFFPQFNELEERTLSYVIVGPKYLTPTWVFLTVNSRPLISVSAVISENESWQSPRVLVTRRVGNGAFEPVEAREGETPDSTFVRALLDSVPSADELLERILGRRGAK